MLLVLGSNWYLICWYDSTLSISIHSEIVHNNMLWYCPVTCYDGEINTGTRWGYADLHTIKVIWANFWFNYSVIQSWRTYVSLVCFSHQGSNTVSFTWVNIRLLWSARCSLYVQFIIFCYDSTLCAKVLYHDILW